MSWTRVLKAGEKVSIDEIAQKLLEIWNKDIMFLYSTNDYLRYFKNKYNWDISEEDYHKAWDLASKLEEQEDDEDEQPLEINGMIFETVEDANNWLTEKLHKYGNTYHFPKEDNYILNKLIEKFGNTYFWNK